MKLTIAGLIALAVMLIILLADPIATAILGAK